MDKNSNAKETPAKRDWEEIVKNSNGEIFFVPEVLISTVKEWQTKKIAFSKSLEVIAKEELEVTNLFQNLMMEIRRYAETTGHSDVWTKNIGFNPVALKEGKYVIHISENEPERK